VRGLVKTAIVLGKAVTVHERASPCREMVLQSMSVFVEAVIVLV
jgi:hypothetical protein